MRHFSIANFEIYDRSRIDDDRQSGQMLSNDFVQRWTFPRKENTNCTTGSFSNQRDDLWTVSAEPNFQIYDKRHFFIIRSPQSHFDHRKNEGPFVSVSLTPLNFRGVYVFFIRRVQTLLLSVIQYTKCNIRSFHIRRFQTAARGRFFDPKKLFNNFNIHKFHWFDVKIWLKIMGKINFFRW